MRKILDLLIRPIKSRIAGSAVDGNVFLFHFKREDDGGVMEENSERIVKKKGVMN